MPVSASHEKQADRLKYFTALLNEQLLSELEEGLSELHPAEIAHLIESLPREQREPVWELVDSEDGGDVLLHVNDDIRAQLIEVMDQSELLAAAKSLETDDLADILTDYPNDVGEQILQNLDEQRRSRLENVMSYPEDSAGGLMNTDTITVRADISLEVVLRYLRRLGTLPDTTDYLIVVDRDAIYQGRLALSQLLTQDPRLSVDDVMSRDEEPILASTSAHDVAALFQQRDLVTAAVVDEQRRLLGRITIDDVVDVIREEADHSLMSMAGLNEEDDMFAPIAISAQRRMVWLGINLLTALLASWVIGQFEETIEKLVALAVLMPIVASMGGIAGSQTLTLVIRGIALRQIGQSNVRRLLNKELAVASLNGGLWAIVVALIAFLWFHDYQLSLIIALAMLVNLLVAALAGVSIPMILNKMGVDPALAGGVVLTTVTDVIGFVAFLGLAAAILV